MNRVILKIDFEKAYDKIKWSFLQLTLRMKALYDEWRAFIHNFVFKVSVAIKFNDDVGRYLKERVNRRQSIITHVF
jgi:hypothetical protein